MAVLLTVQCPVMLWLLLLLLRWQMLLQSGFVQVGGGAAVGGRVVIFVEWRHSIIGVVVLNFFHDFRTGIARRSVEGKSTVVGAVVDAVEDGVAAFHGPV